MCVPSRKVLAVLCTLAVAVSGKRFDWTNSAYLDENNTVLFRWKYTNETIQFEATMPTTGWVGVGFAPYGSTGRPDIIFAWMKNGKPRVLDMHAVSSSPSPMLDAKQDFRSYNLRQNGTHTKLFVDRFLDTCDSMHDAKITDDTTRVIYAFGRKPPVGDLPRKADYHGPNRGMKRLSLLEKKLPALHLEDDENMKYFDIRVDPFTIPHDRDTYYHCSYHKCPVLEQKHHMVQFQIIITPESEKKIRHVKISQCNESFVTDDMLNKTEECYTNDVGDHWQYCSSIVVVWAVGMTNITLPDHVGFPLGTPRSPKVVKLEIYYDNSNFAEGVADSSGVRVFYTAKLRQHDAGILTTGHDVQHTLFVPPGSEKFIVHGHCTSQCLQGILGNGGVSSVNAFEVLLHSHKAGREMILRHYRNGTELQPIAKDLTYDADFQESKMLTREKAIRAGDNLIMECAYDTSERNYTTLGGLSATDEMCFGFIMYYPKVDDAVCIGTVTTTNIYNYFGVTKISDASYAATAKNWTSHEIQQFNEGQLSSPVWQSCRAISGQMKCLDRPYNISSVKHTYQEPDGRCEVALPRRRGKSERPAFMEKR